MLFASCASTKAPKFYVETIDTQEEKVVCAIYRDDELLLDKNNQPILAPAWVEIPFQGEGGVKLGVRGVAIDREANAVRGLREGENSPYLEEYRVVYPTDSKRQLFVLRKNKRTGGS